MAEVPAITLANFCLWPSTAKQRHGYVLYTLIRVLLPTRCYASASISYGPVSLCVSVCHMLILCLNSCPYSS